MYSLASTGDVLWAATYGQNLRAYIDGQWRQYEGSVTARIPNKVVPSCECYRKGATVNTPEQDVIKGIPFVRIGQMRLASDDGGALWLLYWVPSPYNVVRFAGTHLECWDDDALREARFLELGTSPRGTVWAVGDGVVMEFGGEAWTSLEGPPQAEALYTRGGGEAWVTAPDGVWLHTGQGWERKHAHRPLGAALHPEGGLLVAIEGGEVIHLRGDGQTTSLGAPPALFRDSSVPIVERHEPLATRKSSPSRFQSHLHHQLTSAARSPLGHALLHPRTARIRLPPS